MGVRGPGPREIQNLVISVRILCMAVNVLFSEIIGDFP